MSLVPETDLIHLPRKPLAAVHADLDREGQPALDPGVHEPEYRVEAVVVVVRALPQALDDVHVPTRGVLPDIEAPARLHALKDTDQAARDAVLLGDDESTILLVRFRRFEELETPAEECG